VLVGRQDGTVSVALNASEGGTAPTVGFSAEQLFTVGWYAQSLAIADFNGDGKPDVMSVNSGAVSVLVNTTPSGAATPEFLPEQAFPLSTADGAASTTADIDGDGMVDVIVTNYDRGTVSIFINTTTARSATTSFAPVQVFSVGTNPRGIVAADVNCDGRPDLITANYSDDTISVLLNTTRSRLIGVGKAKGCRRLQNLSR
jgi:hypothetical protein